MEDQQIERLIAAIEGLKILVNERLTDTNTALRQINAQLNNMSR